jgi:hypothetical protein
VRSEPEGRAEQPAGGAADELRLELRDRLSDEVIDELLAGARTEEGSSALPLLLAGKPSRPPSSSFSRQP